MSTLGLKPFLNLTPHLQLGTDGPSGPYTPPLSISGTPVLTATQGTPYAGFTATASNGALPYVYSLVGTWPTGITINSATGAVSGTPSNSGSFIDLSVRVTDGASNTATLLPFVLAVTAAFALSITGTPVTTATQNVAYTGFTATAHNGTLPYTYSLVGTWPTGIVINSATGAVSGTPTNSGAFINLSVRVTDGSPATADLTPFTLSVAAASTDIAWTPLMAQPVAWYTATDQSSYKDTGGSTAPQLTAVQTWNDSSGNANHAASAANANGAATAATRGFVGTTGSELTVNGSPVYPLRVGTANQTNRYNTPASTLAMVSGTLGNVLFVFARVTPPASAVARTLLGNSSGNFNYHINVSDTGVQGRVTTGSTVGVMQTDTSTRLEMFVQLKTRTTGNDYLGRYNGNETVNSVVGVGASVPATSRLSIGNVYGGSQGINADLFEVAIFPIGMSRSNQQRMEGWVAWTYGQTALLPAAHPYKSAAPMVPLGTTSTLDWADINTAVSAQTFKGFMVEVQGGAFEAGSPTLGGNLLTNLPGGIPYELVASERTRLATDYLGYGYGIRYLRWAGGLHQNRGVSVSNKNLLAHFTNGTPVGTQLSASEDQMVILKALMDATGHAMEVLYEEWGPAPGFKVNGILSSIGANGGLNYPDPGSNPSGYATWISDYGTNVVANMLLVDTAGFKLAGYSGSNEAGNPAHVQYTSVIFDAIANDRQALADIYTDVIPKVSAASWANTTAANIKVAFNSWDAPGGYANTQILASSQIGSMYHWYKHDLSAVAADAMVWVAPSASVNPLGLPVGTNEFEYFDTVRNAIIATYGVDAEGYMFANTLLIFARTTTLTGALYHMPMIHLGKPTYDSGDVLGYSWTLWRSTLNGTNNSGYAPASALSVGYFTEYPTNWNAVKGLIGSIPWDSVRYDIPYFSNMATGRAAVAFISPGGKTTYVLINRTNTSWAANAFIGIGKTLVGTSYGAANGGTALGAISGQTLTTTVAAYGAQFWVEP